LIVVSYRSASEVEQLLTSVPDSVGELSWGATIVNNDRAEDLAAVLSLGPEVDLIDAPDNVGYAGGINIALASARPSRWTVFLNPDVRLGPGALSRMAHHAGDRHAVVPLILDDHGSPQHSLRREPSLVRAIGDAFLGEHWPSRPGVLSETIRDPSTYRRSRVVDWATGAVLMVPTAIVQQVGPWDETRFFLYSEETDYCRRLRVQGVSVHFLPDAMVTHRGGASGSSDALHALMEVNRVRYFRKWHGPVPSAAFHAVTAIGSLLRARRPRSRAALRALVHHGTRTALPGGTR